MGFVPPSSFPRGWYLVAWSDELAPGQAKPARYFGRDLVVFRTDAGQARIADAHCPHLGAHLGHGGVVTGDRIRCPFHKWEFDGASGRCAAIPFTDRVHPKAALRLWHVHEEAGMILAWFHEEGAAPSWDFPAYEALDDRQWTAPSEVSWEIRAHVYDITENDVDCAHMPAVHDFTERLPATEARVEGPLMHVVMRTEVTLSTFGRKGTIEAPAHTTKVGMGLLLVKQTIDTGRMTIDFRTIGTFTPIDEDHVHIRARHRVKKVPVPFMTGMIQKNYSDTFKETVEQDIPIWENKIYRDQPALFVTDGPIMRFREWSRQFYSEDAIEAAAK
ncbi:MAG: aromatic ring-hydroxylating dioxygenase subunit alpha [Alphaproteobacteria bacterium]|nr:aromatic ring-hydroxylating dioxygenase subunit alpha [Alphaproteobacteria bacterium]